VYGRSEKIHKKLVNNKTSAGQHPKFNFVFLCLHNIGCVFAVI